MRGRQVWPRPFLRLGLSGLDVLVIETSSPESGQAGEVELRGSKIIWDFPRDCPAWNCAARALAQTEKFGAKMMVAHSVERLDCGKHPYKLILDNGN